eukprot:6176577-Pleurochrysis_carterae.AAC.3
MLRLGPAHTVVAHGAALKGPAATPATPGGKRQQRGLRAESEPKRTGLGDASRGHGVLYLQESGRASSASGWRLPRSSQFHLSASGDCHPISLEAARRSNRGEVVAGRMGHEADEGAPELAVLAGSAYADGDVRGAWAQLQKLLIQRESGLPGEGGVAALMQVQGKLGGADATQSVSRQPLLHASVRGLYPGELLDGPQVT